MASTNVPAASPLAADELRTLAARGDGPCVSLVLPLRPAPNSGQNAVHARHAAQEALERLAARALGARERARFAELLGAVEHAVASQAHPVGSLAVFLDAGHFRIVPLARDLPYAVRVGSCFALRPLLRAQALDAPYRALAVSVKQIRLFEGDARGLAPAKIEGLPASLEDALGSEKTEKQHRLRGTAAGGGAPVYYSHDAASDEQKRDLARFHHVLARALAQRFGDDARALVLIADVTHQAGLRAELRLRGLLPQGVLVAPDHLGASEIHARAWPLVCAALAERARDARGRYEAARNAGKALDLLDDVAAAAVAGRIRRIWLEDGRSMAGRVDLASGRIVASEGDDVYDSLAAAVLARAGEVFVVDAAAMPTATGVAAEVH